MPRTVRTTCPYCGVGCGIVAGRDKAGGVTIAGDPDHPANFGRLCSKGAALGETVDLDGRLLHPRMHGRRVDWDTALDAVADGFARTIAEYGPDSVALYVSGQLLTEDYYVANKLMKGAIGSANIDTNSRLCMASTVAGHVRAFGEDVVPQTYEDIEEADVVVLVGSNFAWCHPVLHQRLLAAKRRRGARIVVIDPRRTATAEDADLHLALKPDGDTALFMGLLRDAAQRGTIDADWTGRHTEGLAPLLAGVAQCDAAWTSAQTDVPTADLAAFFALANGTPRVLTIFSQGVNQSRGGTDKVSAILNWHLVTGRIGKPGCGPLSATGQPNAMGGREVGGLANQLAAHRDLSPEDVDAVAGFWGYDRIADKPGLKAVDMFDAVADGRIRAIWIMGTNPVVSMPDADGVRAALKACPLVVVSDVEARTDTVACAHIALPALAWGEKDGTVTNSERRISRQRAFLPAPGEARADWAIVNAVARRLEASGAVSKPKDAASGFAHEAPSDIFAEHARLSAFENDGRRLFDIGGLADAPYETLPPTLWPASARTTYRQDGRLFANGGFATDTGRARLVLVAPPPSMEEDADRLILNTGRVRDHWHTMTRTGRSARLSRHYGEPFVEIHPRDAMRRGIAPASLVRLETPHGRSILRALLTPRVREDELFAPMHWTGETAPTGRVDALIPPIVDPHSGQPASKRVPVVLTPAGMAWYGFALLRERPAKIPAPYWAIARTERGWRLELAGYRAASFKATRTALLGDAPPITVAGPVTIAATPDLGILYSTSDPVPVARDWAAGIFDQAAPDAMAELLAGRPGAGAIDPGATVCSCMMVGVNVIVDAIAAGARDVDAVGAATHAGTQCGSCRSEISRLCIETCGNDYLEAAE